MADHFCTAQYKLCLIFLPVKFKGISLTHNIHTTKCLGQNTKIFKFDLMTIIITNINTQKYPLINGEKQP